MREGETLGIKAEGVQCTSSCSELDDVPKAKAAYLSCPSLTIDRGKPDRRGSDVEVSVNVLCGTGAFDALKDGVRCSRHGINPDKHSMLSFIPDHHKNEGYTGMGGINHWRESHKWNARHKRVLGHIVEYPGRKFQKVNTLVESEGFRRTLG